MNTKKTKPIQLGAKMAKAVQDDKKTGTCLAIGGDFRINQKGTYRYSIRNKRLLWNDFPTKEELIAFASKYKVGDTLWIREPAKVLRVHGNKMEFQFLSDNAKVELKIPRRFLKTFPGSSIINYAKWISGRTGVPNGCITEMARTFVEVESIEIKKIQDMEDKDMQREGIALGETREKRLLQWKAFWNRTAKEGGYWKDNPYVFIYTFRRSD